MVHRVSDAMLASVDMLVVQSLFREATDFNRAQTAQEWALFERTLRQEHALDKDSVEFKRAWEKYLDSPRAKEVEAELTARKRKQRVSAECVAEGGAGPVDTKAAFNFRL